MFLVLFKVFLLFPVFSGVRCFFLFFSGFSCFVLVLLCLHRFKWFSWFFLVFLDFLVFLAFLFSFLVFLAFSDLFLFFDWCSWFRHCIMFLLIFAFDFPMILFEYPLFAVKPGGLRAARLNNKGIRASQHPENSMQFLLLSPLKTCTFKAFPASTHSFI